MSKIVKVEAGRFDYDFVGEFKFFKPGADGIVRRPSVLVRLTDDAGIEGWGQAVPVPSWTYETPESVENTIANYLAPLLLGMEPEDIAGIHARMNAAIAPGLSIGMPLAKAAVDIACYDLWGKQKGQPVWALLGGTEMTANALGWTVNSMDLNVVNAQLVEGRDRGYCNFNFKVGPPQDVAYDILLTERIREFTPDSFLWADANTHYTVDESLTVIPKLAEAGVAVLESPLPPLNFQGYQKVRKESPIPIYMDEGLIVEQAVEQFIAMEMMDGVTIKTARSSGIYESAKIVKLTKEHGLGLLGSGLTDPDLSLAASLHLFAWADIPGPYALNGPQFLGNTLIESGLSQDGDIIQIPDGPGLGVTMKPEAAANLKTAAEA